MRPILWCVIGKPRGRTGSRGQLIQRGENRLDSPSRPVHFRQNLLHHREVECGVNIGVSRRCEERAETQDLVERPVPEFLVCGGQDRVRLSKRRHNLVASRMRMLSLKVVPFRQRREGAHALILSRWRSSGPLELGVQLVRSHPKLEGEGPVENLRREHVGRFVHVNCADNEEVPWQRQPLRFYVTQNPLTR